MSLVGSALEAVLAVVDLVAALLPRDHEEREDRSEPLGIAGRAAADSPEPIEPRSTSEMR